MIIGVPREFYRHEHRVGLSPSSAARMVNHGHEVLVEREAGLGAHFTDRDFQQAGAQIVYSREEVHQRADLLCRVGWISVDELELLKSGSLVCAFHHLAVAPRAKVKRMMELGISIIGYEIIRDPDGRLPVLVPMSEMAGQMAVHLAAHLLQTEIGGRGVLLGNVPSVPPPTVLILGAGTVGHTAARQALDSGAHVIVVDAQVARLRRVSQDLSGRAVTAVASTERLERYTSFADVVIGAVLVPGGRAPFLVTEEMVRGMKKGSVIIDVSIDQGGCVETSRPTTLDEPTFVTHGVTHYCVPNMTANIARTSSRALANATLPYLAAIADLGLEEALRRDPGLGAGVYLYRGRLVNGRLASALELPATPLAQLLEEQDPR